MRLKVAELNIFDLIKDSGDGTIDASKALVMALESKVFQKFAFTDEKIKDINSEILKIKTNSLNNKNKVDNLNYLITVIQEEINNNQKNNEENIEKLTKQDKDLKNEIDENHTNCISQLEKVRLALEEKLAQMKTELDEKAAIDTIPVSSSINNGTNQAIQLNEGDVYDEKKFKALTKKVTDIENAIRQIMSSKEIEEVKSKIKDLQYELQNKLTHDDLKELYTFHYGDVDLINDVKDSINILYDDNRKTGNDIQALTRKLESVIANVAVLQSMPRDKGDKSYVVDITKFIDNAKFMESTKALYKELERLRKESDENRRNIDDILNILKNTPNNENLANVDNKFTALLSDFKVVVNKKYADKYETNKIIKIIENQIKTIQDENAKRAEGGDNWLLAKRPINNFKCASCEANLENLNPSQEYLPWNKYPARDDKSYRMGSGFSHMLQMMSSELVKNYDKKDTSFELEEGRRKKRSFSGIRNQIKSGKISLPKVQLNKKPINLIDDMPHYSDDENNLSENFENKQATINATSPKIVKIMKKKKQP